LALLGGIVLLRVLTPTTATITAAPLVLTRKNALFAGHDLGAKGWAMDRVAD